MRIAFEIYGSLDAVSGGFIYDRALVAALRVLGHDVDVIGLPWQGYARAVVGQLFPRSDRGDAGRHDVIIQDELIHPSVFRQACAGVAARRRTPRVALVHNLRSDQPSERFRAAKRSIERRYFDTVDGVIAVCARTLADVGALVAHEAPAVVAYPGRDHVTPTVDEGLVERRSADPGPLRVLSASALRPHKGLHRLLEALARARVRDPEFDFTLDVAGSLDHRSYVRRIRRQITRLGLSSAVRVHGQRRGVELQDLFRRSHVLALPSDREAYSLASLEALGFGLPVLGTNAGGLGEMFSDGQAGYLLDPGDREAWGEALARLASDRARLARMGCAALARYRAHDRWSEVAVTVQDFLRGLCARRGGDADRAAAAPMGAPT